MCIRDRDKDEHNSLALFQRTNHYLFSITNNLFLNLYYENLKVNLFIYIAFKINLAYRWLPFLKEARIKSTTHEPVGFTQTVHVMISTQQVLVLRIIRILHSLHTTEFWTRKRFTFVWTFVEKNFHTFGNSLNLRLAGANYSVSFALEELQTCLLYTSPSPRDA